MRIISSIIGAAFFISASLCAAAESPPTPSSAPQPAPPQSKSSFTLAEQISLDNRSICVEGKTLSYDIRAGFLTVTDKEEKETANISFIAYFAKPDPENHPRPIAFCFNGGPGSSSIWLHMGFLGPKTLDLSSSPAGYKDNVHSLLSACDLVFIDPVSTGFSTANTKDEAKKFHGVEEDLYSVADFIRLFLTKFQRWNCPKFIIGESYGTLRAVGLAHLLQDHFFINIDGLALISMVLDLQALSDTPSEDLACITILPSLTAIAQYHHTLLPPYEQIPVAQLVQKATTFSIEEYAPALLQGSNLTPERRAYIRKKLSEFTSIPESTIDSLDLRLTSSLFTDEFLQSDRKIIGRFDARTTAFRVPNEPSACPASGYPDPSFYSLVGPFTTAFQSYLSKDLLWIRPEPYVVLTDCVRPWNWSMMSCNAAGMGYLSLMQDFRLAMTKNPAMKVFVAAGYYDLATPYFSQEYSLSHLLLPPKIQANILLKGYESGHMIYMDPSCRKLLFADLSHFVSSIAAQSEHPRKEFP